MLNVVELLLLNVRDYNALPRVTCRRTNKAEPTPAPVAQSNPNDPSAQTDPSTTAGPLNINTATADELDGLPQIGPARAKAIIEARAKAKFKNWDDFVARKVVPADSVAAIKDVVSF